MGLDPLCLGSLDSKVGSVAVAACLAAQTHCLHVFSETVCTEQKQKISEGQIYRQMRQEYHREVNAVSLLRQKKCCPPQSHASKSRIHPQNIGAVIQFTYRV